MRLDQYKVLTDACYALLSDKKIEESRVALPWLHVLNEHPNNLKQYENLFDKDLSINQIRYKRLRLIFSAFLKLSRAKILKRKFKINASPGIVFISHFLNKNQIEETNDFYFGDLPTIVNSINASALLLQINHTELSAIKLNKELSKKSNPKQAIIDLILPFSQEWLVFIHLVKESNHFFNTAKTATSQFERNFYLELSQQSISAYSFITYRVYYQLLNIFSQVIPKVLISTFEGNAWERLAFAVAKKVNPSVCKIGYSHSLMFEKQNACMRKLSAIYNPDLIMTAGTITKRQFDLANVTEKEVIPIGIHRRTQVSKEFDIQKLKKKQNICLITPDGLYSEIERLFDFTIIAAEKMPWVTFVFRLHPVIDKKKLLHDYPRYTNLPNNIQFSEISLSLDFERAKWILYRSSSTAIYAVLEGIRPLYLKLGDEMTADALYELSEWKKVVRSIEDLIAIVNSDMKENESSNFSKELVNAFSYCNNYFLPLNRELFLHSIKSI